jgi:trimeric autotransporter adhesin
MFGTNTAVYRDSLLSDVSTSITEILPITYSLPPTNIYPKGSIIYNNADSNLYYSTGTSWQSITAGGVKSITGNSGPALTGPVTIETLNASVQFVGAGSTLSENFAASSNLSLGSSLPSLTTGVENTAYGVGALAALTTGIGNVAIGNGASGGLTTVTGATSVGTGALAVTQQSGEAFGFQALSANTTGFGNVGIGFQSLLGNISGNLCTAVGFQSGGQPTQNFGATLSTAPFTQPALRTTVNVDVVSSTPFAIGELVSIPPSNYYSIQGIPNSTTLTLFNLGAPNSAPGTIFPTGSLFVETVAGNTTIGFLSGTSNTTGFANTCIGAWSLTANTTGSRNHADGFQTLFNNTTGSFNSGLGESSLYYNTSGSYNTACGRHALFNNTTANYNCSLGHESLFSNTTGTNNVSFGYQSLFSLLTGSNNTVFGGSAGTAYTGAESNNILIGYNVTGTLGESNVLRIGTGTGTGAGQINATYISGIYGSTVGGTESAVVIDNTGKLGTVISSGRFKTDIQDMTPIDITKLRPVTFRYIDDEVIRRGLIAEEVERVDPRLVTYDENNQPKSVKYHDLPIILLAEIQKLREELNTLKASA